MVGPSAPRVLIVAENASMRFGGEAFIPFHYFQRLRKRGVECFLLTHARVKNELLELLPQEADRIHFIPDTHAQAALWQVGKNLPAAVHGVTLGPVIDFISQRMQRERARELVALHRIDVVHQPIPVSPRQPSALYDLGAPVVIGPMNGNMTYPEGFAQRQGGKQRALADAVRAASDVANRLVPGKRKASLLLVANSRTAEGLPPCVSHVPVVELVENGVDLARFQPRKAPAADGPLRMVFLGRLVDWKAVDLLLDAIAALPAEPRVTLDILGDGVERRALEAQAARLGLQDRVRFLGFVPQDQAAQHMEEVDALVLPSLYECGGAVVLEAMAKGLPVIATRWGGPADYLDDHCGILVDPTNRQALVDGLRDAIARLSASPDLRRQLGEAGRRKVEQLYDWERKVDRILELYASLL